MERGGGGLSTLADLRQHFALPHRLCLQFLRYKTETFNVYIWHSNADVEDNQWNHDSELFYNTVLQEK